MSAIGRRTYAIKSIMGNKIEIIVWERENPEDESEKFYLSIENQKEMQDIEFEIEDVEEIVEKIKLALKFVKFELIF